VTRDGNEVLGRVAMGGVNLDDGVAGWHIGCCRPPVERVWLPGR